MVPAYVKTSTSPTKICLDPSPPAEPFIEGLSFGSTIDAITGEIHRSIVDTKQSAPQDVSTGMEREKYSSNQFSSASEIEKFLSLSFSSSIAFPVDGLNISAKRGFDFSNSTTSQVYSHFYMITWESEGKAKALPENPTLYKDAQGLLDKKDWAGFRKAYGDYFVHQIQTRARFSALWRCTANSQSDIQKFATSLNAAVTGPKDISATVSFEAALKESAKTNNTTLEVHFDTLGQADVKFDEGNVAGTLDKFRKNVKPANEKVFYRHHSFLNKDFPAEVDITQERYLYLVKLFSTASAALVLSGLAPATVTTRLRRRTKIVELYKEIHAKRLANDKDGSSSAMKQISSIYDKLLTLLDRQELVMKVSNLTSDGIKKLFQVDHENERGAWVKSASGHAEFRFGETSLDPVRYGVKQSVSHCQVGFVLLQQQVGTLDFPASGIGAGTAVGIKVTSNWTDGTNGLWCIPPTNPLGTPAFKIEVKTLGSRGMNWSMYVTYIPDEEYTDMQF